MILRSHPLHVQHLGEDPRHQILHRIARRHVAHGTPRRRQRQRPPVHLAARRQRQARQLHPCRRHHQIRQLATQEAPQLSRRRALAGRDPPRHQTLLHPLPDRSHHRLLDSGMRAQRRLDLPQLDAVATHLDLVVDPPQKLQPSLRTPAHQVSRPVQPRPRLPAFRPRVRREALRRQLRRAQISPRQARATDPQLSGHPQRRQLHPRSNTSRRVLAIGPPTHTAPDATSAPLT